MLIRASSVPGVAVAGLVTLFATTLALSPRAQAGVKVDLEFDPPVIRRTPWATVALTVSDERDEKFGGLEADLVGQVRGGYGNPYGLFAREPDVLALIERYIEAGLVASGCAVSREGGDSLPTVRASLRRLWTDGYVGYDAALEIRFSVYPAHNERAVWSAELSASVSARSRGAFVWNTRWMAEMFADLFRGGFSEMERVLSEPAFSVAIRGASRADDRLQDAPESAAPLPIEPGGRGSTEGGGCGKDTDCKGDRICVDARCVEPQARTVEECGKDTDCPGDLVCRRGRCQAP
jgi:hypothetical protein